MKLKGEHEDRAWKLHTVQYNDIMGRTWRESQRESGRISSQVFLYLYIFECVQYLRGREKEWMNEMVKGLDILCLPPTLSF